MKVAKRILIIAVTLMLAIVLVACGQTKTAEPSTEPSTDPATDSEQPTQEKQITIGFDNMMPSVEFFLTVQKGLEDACAANNIKLVSAFGERDAAKMVSNVDSFVLQGANIIVDFNVLPEVGNTIVESMSKKDIPVLSIDSVYDGAYFFGVNNQQVGETAAKYAADVINEKWGGEVDYVVEFYSEGGGPVVKLRNSANADYLKKELNLTDDQIVYIPAANDSVDAINGKVQFADFLTAHPDAHKIYLHVLTDQGAVGALAALEAAGRMDDCFITSCDAGTEALDNLRLPEANAWVGSVAAFPEKYGENIVKYCIDIMNGDAPQERFTDNVMIDRNNIDEYYPES